MSLTGGVSARFPRKAAQAFTVGDIAALTEASARPGAQLAKPICGAAGLDLAGPHDITVALSERDQLLLRFSRAGACLVSRELADQVPTGTVGLAVSDPYRAFVDVAARIFLESLRPASHFGVEGIAAGAWVHPSAQLEPDVTVDPGAVVGPRAQVGMGTVIGPGATLGPGVCVGRHCRIGAGVSLVHALLGDGVVVHAGARIGQGGCAPPDGSLGAGRVIVQDQVEIGANSVVDAGGLRDTVVGERSKIGNLVQIARNAVVGRCCMVGSQATLVDHVTLGDFAIIGAYARIDERVTIDEGTTVSN